MPAKGDGAALRLAQLIHRVGGVDRGLLVDMNEGPRALAGGIGNSGETFLDQFARGGAASGEIGGERWQVSVVRHGCPVLDGWSCATYSGGAP